MNNNSNMMLAIVLSLGVLLGYHYFFEVPRIEAQKQAIAAQQAAKPAEAKAPVADVSPARERTAIVADGFAAGERIKINSPRLHGSLNLRGARVDDLTLADYRETVADASPEVVLLAPSGTAPGANNLAHAYFAEFGWLADAGVKTPAADTVWQANSKELTPDKPLTLTWNNGGGLTFTRTIALDSNYMFTVTDAVQSSAGSAITLYPYSAIARHAQPKVENLFILHEGALGVFNGTLQEHTYATLHEDGAVEARHTDNTVGSAWLGLTDKYWLVAMLPDAARPFTGRMQEVAGAGDNARYQIDARSDAVTIPAGGRIETTTRLFAGAKEVRLLDAYEKQLNVARFDLAVDFGWFYFLTKPFFYALDAIATYFKDTGHGFAWAIILFTILLKLLFFPLQNKSYKAMNRMKLLQPKMMELRDRYKDDKQQMNMQLFELYKREKVNPMAGCWPVLLQIPVFFALYKVLYVSIEMRHAAGWGWITDLSAPDPTNMFNLFGLLPFTPPSFLAIGALPLLMGFTMYLQQKLSPTAPDPVQAAMFRWMPVIFTFMLAHFPAGLVMYWTLSNIIGIAQQWVLLKRHK
jgi:YidC/Oxa1 family membrane protein insertase